ncbi:dihydroxy-acid dehydratase, partial [Collinsella aerofaciens]|uniref:dihydroxy-acid dehydratase domain-containing protein n=3 Tax=Bacillati TaxID=1783272 RepID=UPI001EDEE9DD
ELVKKDIRPSQLITKETLLNAIIFDTAVAGSTNAILHILTYAYELGVTITLDDFAKYAKEIPLLLNVIPSGPYTVYECHYAGGVPAIMKMLQS